jgi:hypothetical protein
MITSKELALVKLEEAACEVVKAKDSNGLAIRFCRDPMDADVVREDLHNFARFFKPENNWLNDGEEAGCRNLALLANLLAAHLNTEKEGA